jgi:hypothetical protein
MDPLYITSHFLSDALQTDSDSLLAQRPFILAQGRVSAMDVSGKTRYKAVVQDDRECDDVMFSEDVSEQWSAFAAANKDLLNGKECAICITDYMSYKVGGSRTKLAITEATWDLRVPKAAPQKKAEDTSTRMAEAIKKFAPGVGSRMPVFTKPKAAPVHAGESFNGSPLILISKISPIQRDFALHVRVTKLGPVKSFNGQRGPGRLWPLELEDSSGTIRACMFGGAIDMHEHALNVGDSVYISEVGQVKTADPKWNTCSSRYELTLNEGTRILPAAKEAVEGPSIERYNFVPMDQALTDPKWKGKKIDLIGVLVGFETTVRSFTSAKGRQISKRALSLADTAGNSLKLEILGDLADTIALPFRADEHMDGDAILEEGSVAVLAKGVEVGEYNGEKTFGVPFSPTVRLVDLGVKGKDLDAFLSCAQAHPPMQAFHAWYSDLVKSTGALDWNSGRSPRESAFRLWVRGTVQKKNPTLRTFLGQPLGMYKRFDSLQAAMNQLQESPTEPVYCSVLACFTAPKDRPARAGKDGTEWPARPALRSFYSCPKCKGKVTQEVLVSGFHCERCNTRLDSALIRCDLSAQIVDSSHAGYAHLFDEAARSVIGLGSKEDAVLIELGEDEARRAVLYQKMAYEPMVVSAKISEQVRDGQVVTSIAVSDARKPDWAFEAGLLVEKIRLLQMQ